MTKKGFTLMELLVSVFITGMVMLSLVAMWKTSSNHTAQAQRQSVIKNENTIFLRSFYDDFVSASEVLAPNDTLNELDQKNRYIALKEAIVDPSKNDRIVRLSQPVCGEKHDSWGTGTDPIEYERRCIRPSFVVYQFKDHGVYKCRANFLDSADELISFTDFYNLIGSTCSDESNNWTLLLPYVESFLITDTSISTGAQATYYPELLIEYTVKKEFSSDVPPVYFKMKRYFVKKKGV